jgi:hypothetical protein
MEQVFFPARLQLSPVGIFPPMRHTRIDSCTFDAIQPWILTEIKTLPATGTLSFVKEREDVKLPYRPTCLLKHTLTKHLWYIVAVDVVTLFVSWDDLRPLVFFISLFIIWDCG